MLDYTEYRLGESSDETLNVSTRDENAEAALELIKQCKQKLAIISQELDPLVYDQADLIEAMRQLTLKGRNVEIRIIVFEPELIVRKGHKLIDLAGKVSSFIEMRKVANEYKSFNEAVLIADNSGYLYRESTERYRGKLNFNGRRESKHLLGAFNTMWETSKQDPNLRRVHI